MAGGLDAAGPSGGAVRNTTISSPTVAITAISSSWSKTLQSQFARGVVSTISGWPRGYFEHIAGYTVSEDGLELNNCCVELTDRVRTSTRESSRAIPMNRGSKHIRPTSLVQDQSFDIPETSRDEWTLTSLDFKYHRPFGTFVFSSSYFNRRTADVEDQTLAISQVFGISPLPTSITAAGDPLPSLVGGRP
jgi:hypothetical protein